MQSMRKCMVISAALAAFASSAAFAQDGTINFTGEIVGTPCQIAPGDQNMTVPLGMVAQSTLNGAAGTTSAPVRFTINLQGCDATAKGASLKFQGTPDADAQGLLRLANAGQVGVGKASGVAIGLADSVGNRIPLGMESSDYVIGEGDNALQFQAMYVATKDQVTAGPANASAQFTITYK